MPLVGPSGHPWYVDVLERLGIGPDAVNTRAMALWAASEGMPETAFNWLAATDVRAGSHRYNSAGVQVYPSWSTGVEVVVTKLASGTYRAIRDTLDGGSLAEIYDAINASPWCAGCSGGHYPIALFSVVAAGGADVTTAPVGPPDLPPAQVGPNPDAWDHLVEGAAGWFRRVTGSISDAADVLSGL